MQSAEDVRTEAEQLRTARTLRDSMHSNEYRDLNYDMLSGVQARLTTFAMLDRREIVQHGRILRIRLRGTRHD